MADSDFPTPPEGIRVWRNAGNLFTVLRLHWTADPEKRLGTGREEMRRIRAQIGERAWQREYEINAAVPEGEAVFPEFDATRMVKSLRVLPGAKPLRGWDFGHVCPVVLIAQLDPYARLQILREIILPGAALELLADAAQAAVVDLWGQPKECFDAGDPSAEKMTDLGQIKHILAGRGILLHTVRSTEGSYAVFRSRLQEEVVAGAEGRTPRFLVDPVGCPVYVKALSGAFHKSARPPYKPVDEHPYKDVCDAGRYLNENLRGQQGGFMAKMREIAGADIVGLSSR